MALYDTVPTGFTAALIAFLLPPLKSNAENYLLES